RPNLVTGLSHFRKAIQDAEGANKVFLGNQAGEGGHSRLPGAKAKRGKEERNRTADAGQKACIVIRYHTKLPVGKAKALQEPQHNGGGEDDGTGALDEGPAAFPSGAQNVAPGRDMVSGKLHDKRSGISGKQLRFL